MASSNLQMAAESCSAVIATSPGHWEMLVGQMEQKFQLNSVVYNAAINSCEWRQAWQLLQQMGVRSLQQERSDSLQRAGIETTAETHGSILTSLDEWPHAMEHLRVLADGATFGAMLQSSLRAADVSCGAAMRTCKAHGGSRRDQRVVTGGHDAKVSIKKRSTDGSEPSHMRYRGETPDCSRGYEAWLLKEAKARNPLIRTYALAWGVPGWIGNGTFFSEDNIHYHVSWLKCIKERYDIDIDYMGLWNEMPWGDVWYVFDLASAIKESLGDAELSTQLVLLDQASSTASADFLSLFRRDERFQELVAAVGLHYPCWSPRGIPGHNLGF
eukprot:s147_g3.t1